MIPGPRVELVNGRIVTVDSHLADQSHKSDCRTEKDKPQSEHEHSAPNSNSAQPGGLLHHNGN